MKVSVALLIVCLLLTSSGRLASGKDPRAQIPPPEDPGHNAHQEGIIFACLGLIVVLAVLCTIILWHLVERTKFEIRRLDAIIPEIAERMRKETVTANGELMSGTLTASHEFETEFITNEEVQLTSYRRRNDKEEPAEASATAEETTNENTEVERRALRREGESVPRTEDERGPRRDTDPRANHNDCGRRSHRHERYERYSHHGPRATPHDRLEDVLRANHAYGSRRPPPPYPQGYDNPGMSLRDERDYHRPRREGPRPAPKPAKRSSRAISAYLTSDNEYPDESRRPVSVIGLISDEEERRPRRHGHGRERRYKSLLYESHV